MLTSSSPSKFWGLFDSAIISIGRERFTSSFPLIADPAIAPETEMAPINFDSGYI